MRTDYFKGLMNGMCKKWLRRLARMFEAVTNLNKFYLSRTRIVLMPRQGLFLKQNKIKMGCEDHWKKSKIKKKCSLDCGMCVGHKYIWSHWRVQGLGSIFLGLVISSTHFVSSLLANYMNELVKGAWRDKQGWNKGRLWVGLQHWSEVPLLRDIREPPQIAQV